MNIAIVGYGKMGKVIEKIAVDKGLNVISTIDPNAEDAQFKEINKESLKDVDVCIEFTAPSVALENIRKIAELGKSVVVGTTAWYDKLDEAKQIVKDNKIGLIYSPNFSIGVNVFFSVVKNASKIMNNLKDYGIYMKEIHHVHKKDAPSGTGKKIRNIVEEEIERFSDTPIESVREGEVPGTHTVHFESDVDIIKLEHEAKSRQGFASGSVVAAEWLKDKKGFFSIEDLMKDLIR